MPCTCRTDIDDMRMLTDVFGPGAAPLPEGLRTLQASPSRIVEPGQTVHVNFTFRNLGGGTATGFRVRFRLPEGLTYLVGTASLDDQPIDEQGGLTTLLQASGADIGEVPAGGERRISLAYTVAQTIENGTPIAIQAAIASFEVPVIGSNVVRLVVRSRPTLKNEKTKLTMTPVREALPGEELALKAQVHNSGQSSAHDIMVFLPVPANTTFVTRSVRIDGREPEGLPENEPFGFGRPVVVGPTLGPGATVEVGYRVKIDSVLEDKALVEAQGAICSQELAEFSLKPVTLKVPSAAAFTAEDTTFSADCDDALVPGQRVKLALGARNSGTARARNVRLKLTLPEGIAFLAGSRSIDGAAAVDTAEPGVFALGDLEPGRTVEVGLAGVVRSPLAHGHELALGGRLEWSKGERTFSRSVTVRSAPSFPAAVNMIERTTPRRLEPGAAATYTLRVANMGTDVAHDARVLLDSDPGLENLRAFDGDTEIGIADGGVISLDALKPNAARTLRLEAKFAPALEDQSQLRLRATLRTAQIETVELGSATHVVASRPRFSAATSQLTAESTDALRPNRTTPCKLSLANEGTDRGRDVRIKLQLPEELRLEHVDGAAPDGAAIVFGDVPAGESREAIVHLRLVGMITPGDVLEVGGRVGGLNVVPFSLEPLKLTTHAEASFADDATLTSSPEETVDAGAEVVYTLALRNTGDGTAKRLSARVDVPTNAVYAPGSTSVNDVPLLDFAGTSPLLASNGVTLGDIGAGVEVVFRFRVIVNTPLAAGTPIDTRAAVSWDEKPEVAVRAESLRVRSAPALPIVAPELPFSVIDAAAAPRTAIPTTPTPALPHIPREPEALQLPPAVPVVRENGYTNGHGNGNGNGHVTLRHAQSDVSDVAPLVSLRLDDAKLAEVIEYLDVATDSGLVPHLMVLRALFPEELGGDATVRERLERHAELVGERIDRIFLKSRLPGAPLLVDDLESAETRVSLRFVFDALRAARWVEHEDDGELRLVGDLTHEPLGPAADGLDKAPLGTAAAWYATALLLGTTLERGRTVVSSIAPYRDALLRQLSALIALEPAAFLAVVRNGPVDAALIDARAALVHVLRQAQAERDAQGEVAG